MAFSSIIFLFAFLPLTYILYLVLPGKKIKNAILIFASLLFYAWGEKAYVLLMLLSTVINCFAGILIARDCKRKLILSLSVVFNIGMLFAFKYVGLFVTTLNLLPFVEIAVPNIHLPIGISFFTFQVLSYVIDVYRDSRGVQKSYPRLLLYISFFPQLIAGPIVKYHDIEHQLEERTLSVEKVSNGIRRFIIGLSKKVLIADVMALVVDSIFGNADVYGATGCAWLAVICYSLQIYFDFSGYSDMAIGLGKMFGFDFMENFNYPYVSCSIKEFWRRWHISLSTWFREYLYIPLGGNRKGELRTCLNTMIVFLATGIWHGASYTFIVWGIYHGLLLVLERSKFFVLPKIKIINRIYTLLAVVLGFMVFRAESLSEAGRFLVSMFSFNGLGDAVQYLTPYFIFTSAIAIIACVPIKNFVVGRLENKTAVWKLANTVSYAVSLVLLLVCIMSLASGSYSPFIYFRF